MFATEHEFTLPMGYLDPEGTLHRRGVMRLATAADEILPLKDPRVQKNAAYLAVLLLARVVTRLGPIEPVTPNVIEGLFAADLAHLQALYNEVNRVDEGATVVCPQCQHAFALDGALAGGS
ncbi:hypothetical protein tb265_48960 [Gemmatimonadetes bacterium T265]|nr:hypothetical protein tb265_48960 [Gemmatimonadetes bacterium T265]